MGYVYSALWFVISIMLIVRFRKESKVVYVLSGYFAFMGCWWLVNQFVEADLLSGVYGWIFRGVSAVVMAVLIIAYFREKQRIKSDSKTEK